MPRIRSSINKILTLFVGSTIGYKAYTYSSVEALDKSKVEQENYISSSTDVRQNNLIKLSKLENDTSSAKTNKLTKPRIKKCISQAKNIVERFMAINTVPGLCIGISYKGNTLWTKGFGFANLEQGSKCHENTVMRIASISKPLTMLLVAKLIDEGKLDLNKPISFYLKDKFPKKTWKNKPVEITVGQLASHLGGIRDYKSIGVDGQPLKSNSESFEFRGIIKHYNDVYESLQVFKDDDLIAEPGTDFNYTSFGWVLISAVVQSVLEKDQKFENYLVNTMLKQKLGMVNTYLDVNDSLIPNRANYYEKSKNSTFMNAPFVDNSYKWAGGGILSTIPDLLKFGNVMLYSYLGERNDPIYGNLKGFLKKETVKSLWTPVPACAPKIRNFMVSGMGWFVIDPKATKIECASCSEPPFAHVACHTGSAIGASSVLIILPEEEIVIAAFCNLGPISLYNICCDVIKIFLKELKPTNND